MMIRPATEADIGSLTWILLAASTLDPNYPYRFPNRHLYPEDFEERCKSKCREYLNTATVMVCELPSKSEGGWMQAVAFSVWAYERPHESGLLVDPALPRTCTASAQNGDMHNAPAPRRDANPARVKAFLDTCAAHQRKIDDMYPEGYIFLKLLVCHPDYQRRGAGRSLTQWGINRAREMGLPAALFSSPLGLKLYKKLNFSVVGKFRVQVQGEADFLEIPALVLETGGTRTRRLDEGVENTTLVVQVA